MYKIFLKFPEALRPAFPRLKEKLEDPDSGKTCLNYESRYNCVWRRNFDVEMMCVSCNRCAVSGGECHLWAGTEESPELPVSCTALLQVDDQFIQQLGPHQDHQTGMY